MKLDVLNQGGDAVKIVLHGVIRKAFSWEDEDSVISSKRVINLLKEHEGKDLDIHINSKGGDVFESIAIRNAFLEHKGTICAYVDAIAASGASIILTGADKVFMYKNAMQMIHCAWTIASGNAKDLRKIADDLEKIDEAVKGSYDKFVGNDEELKALLEAETFLTAEECLSLGFADQIIEKQKEPKEEVKVSLLKKYSNEIHDGMQANILDKFKKEDEHEA